MKFADINTHKGLILGFAIVLGLLLFTMVSMRSQLIQNPAMNYGEIVSDLPVPIHPNQTVELGIFVQNIYRFEAENNTFDSDGWVWLKYSPWLHAQMAKRKISAVDLINFINLVNRYDFTLSQTSNGPLLMPDGRYYERFRYSGHFYVDDLDFRKFPFQTISLPLIVQLQSQQLRDDVAPIELTIDRRDSTIGPFIDISSYETIGYELRGLLTHWMSRMGNDLRDGTGVASELRMEVHYKKALNSTFLKLILPLLTVMLITLFSPSIASHGWDVRIGIPPTCILTLIFLQQSYHEHLPDFQYLTFLDSVYNLCFFINITLFGLFLWGANVYHSASGSHKRQVAELIDRVDFRFQIGLSLVLVLGTGFDWLVHRYI